MIVSHLYRLLHHLIHLSITAGLHWHLLDASGGCISWTCLLYLHNYPINPRSKPA